MNPDFLVENILLEFPNYQLPEIVMPERRLLIATLVQGIRDAIAFESYRERGEPLPHHLRELSEKDPFWLFYDRSTEPWSFYWLCVELDMDPRRIRKYLRENWDTLKKRRFDKVKQHWSTTKYGKAYYGRRKKRI